MERFLNLPALFIYHKRCTPDGCLWKTEPLTARQIPRYELCVIFRITRPNSQRFITRIILLEIRQTVYYLVNWQPPSGLIPLLEGRLVLMLFSIAVSWTMASYFSLPLPTANCWHNKQSVSEETCQQPTHLFLICTMSRRDSLCHSPLFLLQK